MNQGIYNLMLAELEQSRREWDAMMAEHARELERIVHSGNGTLKDDKDDKEGK